MYYKVTPATSADDKGAKDVKAWGQSEENESTKVVDSANSVDWKVIEKWNDVFDEDQDLNGDGVVDEKSSDRQDGSGTDKKDGDNGVRCCV
jgi:hypothetical protein